MRNTLLFITILFSVSLQSQGPGSANHFDGTDERIRCENANLILGTTFTQELWVYPEADERYWKGIIVNNGGGFRQRPPSIYTYSNTNLQIGFGDGTTNFVTQVSGSPLDLTKWNHIATTFDGDYYRLYINGVKIDIDSTFAKGKVPYARPLKFISENFVGRVDEVRIWDVVRTQAEIIEYMCQEIPNPQIQTGLIAYYKLNDGSGLTATNEITDDHATLENMDDSNWMPSDAFNVWLGGTANWNIPSNWSLDKVPDINHRVGIYLANAPDLNGETLEVDVAAIGSNVTLGIVEGCNFTTDRAFANAGITKIGGVFSPAIYEDANTTEYNGTVSQTILDLTYHNLVLNNSFGSPLAFAGDKVVVKNDFKLLQGNIVVPPEMLVGGYFILDDPTTVFTLASNTVIDVKGDFSSVSSGMITDDGLLLVYGKLSMLENLVGLGTVFSEDYEENYEVFGVPQPVDGETYSGHTWTGKIDSDWFNTENWSSGTLPDNTVDVTIHAVTNQPVIDVNNGVAKNIYVSSGVSLAVIGGTLTAHGPRFINDIGGTITVTGGELIYSGGDNSEMSNFGDLNVTGGKFTSTCTQLINYTGGDITVNGQGVEFKQTGRLENYSSISISNNAQFIKIRNWMDNKDGASIILDESYMEISGQGLANYPLASLEIRNNAELQVNNQFRLYRDAVTKINNSTLTVNTKFLLNKTGIFSPADSELTIASMENWMNITFDNCQVNITGDADMEEGSQMNLINGSNVLISPPTK